MVRGNRHTTLEIHCPDCRKVLQVADDAAPSEVVCPGCGAVIGAAENPFQSPGEYPDEPAPQQPLSPFTRRYAEYRIAGPAAWMIATGAIGLALKGGSMIEWLFRPKPMILKNPLGYGLADLGMLVSHEVGLLLFGLEMALCLLVLFGGWKMKRLDNYGLGVSAAIIAMIPGLSPCCMFGFPFGIWALTVLGDHRVRAAFRR